MDRSEGESDKLTIRSFGSLYSRMLSSAIFANLCNIHIPFLSSLFLILYPSTHSSSISILIERERETGHFQSVILFPPKGRLIFSPGQLSFSSRVEGKWLDKQTEEHEHHSPISIEEMERGILSPELEVRGREGGREGGWD